MSCCRQSCHQLEWSDWTGYLFVCLHTQAASLTPARTNNKYRHYLHSLRSFWGRGLWGKPFGAVNSTTFSLDWATFGNPVLWAAYIGKATLGWSFHFDFNTFSTSPPLAVLTVKSLTILQSAPPSEPPQQQCSASRSSGPHGQHAPSFGPQTKPLWVHWPSAGSVDFWSHS